MDEVTGAYSKAIAVASDDYDGHLVIGQLDALGNRQGPSVQVIEPVGVNVVRELATAPDAGDDHHLVRKQASAGSGLLDRDQDAKVATAWAPGWLLLGVVQLEVSPRARH